MAPVPYTATGKLQILYNVQTLQHRLDLPVDLVNPGTDNRILNHQPGGSMLTGQQGCDAIWTYMSALYPTTVLVPNYILYMRSGSAFVPVESGAGTGGPGTNVAGSQLGSQLTFTFKDELEHRQNISFQETSYAAPGKSTVNTTPASFQAIIDQMITSTLGLDWRDFVRSRGDGTPTRRLYWTNTLNRVTRKRRGLA